jgi:hypothetical protein
MKITEKSLRELIRNLLSEVLTEDCGCGNPDCEDCNPTDDVSEINSTANIDGYQTPFAFDSKDEDDHKDSIKDTAEVFDFKTTENEKNNTVSEGRSLYHIYRDHPDMTPRQKIGVTIREINNMLVDVEKLVNVSSKFKSETSVNNVSYWKTTTRYLDKLDLKLQRISEKVRELR